MLYSVILRDSDLNNDWTLSKDNYGNEFFANESIHQRIRLGKNVEPTLKEVKVDGNYKSYQIPSSMFFSNNNKNMNLNIVNFWTKNAAEKKSHVDQDIMYVTVSTKNFKMLEYSVADRINIIQTYHMVNTYVGCALTVTGDNDSVITIKGFDTETKRFCIYTLGITNGEVVTKETNIVPRDEVKKLASLNKKYSNFSLGFKMITNPGKLLTKTYIINEKDFSKIQEITANIKDAVIISISDPDVKSFSDEDKEELKKIILDNNIRAVTTCNVNLPKTFCKDFKILYMFNYDIERNNLTCTRSN